MVKMWIKLRRAAAKKQGGCQDFYQMTNSDQTHPLGEEETDEINPAVVDGLTPEQLEWLNRPVDGHWL